MLLAAIGAGGKSSALLHLAGALQAHPVLFTTTTHICARASHPCRLLLTDPDPAVLLRELTRPGAICTGYRNGEGKLGPLPPALLAQAVQVAPVTLYEADGAHRLPLKLHADYEPVLLPETDRCLVVAGLSALGRPIGQVVHRFHLNPRWAAEPDRPVDTEVVLTCVLDAVRTSGLPRSRCRVLLNQTDTLAQPQAAAPLIDRLRQAGLDCRAGSLARNPAFLAPWLLDGLQIPPVVPGTKKA